MTEPLKPRIDFDGPLEVDQNPKFRAQQTFDENQAQKFLPRPRSTKRRKKRGKSKR